MRTSIKQQYSNHTQNTPKPHPNNTNLGQMIMQWFAHTLGSGSTFQRHCFVLLVVYSHSRFNLLISGSVTLVRAFCSSRFIRAFLCIIRVGFSRTSFLTSLDNIKTLMYTYVISNKWDTDCT